VLHPRYKLTYFKSAGWEDSWIKTAEKLVRDRFQSDYDEIETLDASPDTSNAEDLEQQVRAFVFLASLPSLIGALGSFVIRKYIRQSSIARLSQIHRSGRRDHSVPQC